ncbi:vWA domain-containing protein [Granulicoccus phenolivorans]|uniref:vWA domain-containing protein n=1 Tax=Granulicoccus phenolivorans TaxID=266854 RepID=UPI0003FF0D41|nr:VWA domain-containing protein [Granulicoccus phenolivorans]
MSGRQDNQGRHEHRGFARYGRYLGGPDPLAPPVDIADALADIGREVMEGTSLRRALQEYLRRGGRDRGLDDLARQVARKRSELLRRHKLDGTLSEIRELLDRAVLAERKQLARDLDDDARFAEMQLENLPSRTSEAVNELRDYQWRSPEARQAYQQIADLMGREALDQRFAGMKQALQNATEADRQAVNEMLADLNQLLEAHARGEDTDQQFADFMAKHGEFFPENPQTIDELLDALAQRAAAARRMRNSLTPEQRAELDALTEQAFGSPELSQALSRLDNNLMNLRPDQDWWGEEGFEGEQGLGMGEATGVMQQLSELDQLSEQLSQEYAGASLDDIDLDTLMRQLGAEAGVDAQRLRDLEKALRDSGYLERGSDDVLRLSPRAMRQLGKTLLKDVADRIAGRGGQRDTRTAGAAGERTGSSRAWEFGDTEPWDVTRTVSNAVARTVAEGGDPRAGVRLGLDDVEVTETEARTRAAVALLVDTSFSMVMEGRWLPMKQTALALHQLITTRFRGDELTLIGFGREAMAMDIAELTALPGARSQGTNLHHALMLANRFFRRNPTAQPVLLIVTDGEPTAHLEPDGEAYFDYPPAPHTIAVTVQELDAAMRLGSQITFFRLGGDPGLERFLDELARRVEGRVVAPQLDDLGAAVVGSYLSDRG